MYGQEEGWQLPILRRLSPDELRDHQGCFPCAGHEKHLRQWSRPYTDDGPVHTREMVPSRHEPRPIHKQQALADDTRPWTIISFRSPIVVELKDIASGRKQIVHWSRMWPVRLYRSSAFPRHFRRVLSKITRYKLPHEMAHN